MDPISPDNLVKQLHRIYLDALQQGPLDSEPSESLRSAILTSIDSAQQAISAPEIRDVTILLSDLRGFTSLSEHYSPLEIIDLLNRYFTAMTEVIGYHGGRIDKFMGDAIMVVFGTPDAETDDLNRALQCAIEMQIRLDKMNEENRALGYPPLYMGIGINTGQVVAGTVGSDLYHEYTVIGDHVNLASRVESFSLRGQVLISEYSYERCQDYVEIGQTNTLSMKGKERPVKLFELLAINYPKRLETPKTDGRKSPRIEVNMPITFNIVEGKSVSASSLEGTVIDLGYGGMYIASQTQLPAHTEIRFPWSLSMSSARQSDVYARVIRINPRETEFHYHLEFSSINADAETAIRNYINRIIEPN